MNEIKNTIKGPPSASFDDIYKCKSFQKSWFLMCFHIIEDTFWTNGSQIKSFVIRVW